MTITLSWHTGLAAFLWITIVICQLIVVACFALWVRGLKQKRYRSSNASAEALGTLVEGGAALIVFLLALLCQTLVVLLWFVGHTQHLL